MGVSVRALLSGRVRPLSRGENSAISKAPHSGRVRITRLGIVGDAQADTVHHGGPDKALHHYPFDHYARWRQESGHVDLNAVGTFGENISTLGLAEDDVCIGDRFRFGSVLVEVSQARKPCWKQGDRLDWTALPKLMVTEGRSGWYYRVIEEGEAEAGDTLTLVERPLPDWSVRRVFDLIVAGKPRGDKAAFRALADMDVLFDGWRKIAAERLRD
ncbi:MOSC domain-containing protein [Chakrabartia godavariana]|nr:MOSC domain-containing protein [Chakrabartia godavariana]